MGTPASNSSTAKVSRNMWEWQRFSVPFGFFNAAILNNKARERVQPRLQVWVSPLPLQKK